MVVGVFHFTNQIEIASGAVLATGLYARLASRLLPPLPGGEFFPPPRTDAFQPR
jgi:hypothetical protein